MVNHGALEPTKMCRVGRLAKAALLAKPTPLSIEPGSDRLAIVGKEWDIFPDARSKEIRPWPSCRASGAQISDCKKP